MSTAPGLRRIHDAEPAQEPGTHRAAQPAAPLKNTRLYGTNGGAQNAGRFLDRAFLDVAEEDRSLKLGAQAIDRFGQEFPALAPPTSLFGTWTIVHEGLRNRFQSVVGAIRKDFKDSPPSAQQHEGFVHGDASQPGRELRHFLKIIEMKKSLVKTFLDNIFGILVVIGYALRHSEDPPLVATK